MRLTKKRLHIDRFGLDRKTLSTFQSRHVKKVSDQALHPSRRHSDRAVLLAILVRQRLRGLEKRRSEHYRVERVAEIVRNDRQDFLARANCLLGVEVKARVIERDCGLPCQIDEQSQ